MGEPTAWTSPEELRDELVDAAAKLAPDLADLIRLYFRYTPAEEIVDDTPADLVGTVRAHLQLAQDRMPGRPVVRLLNPTLEVDGWAHENTVVQIVTDDMPYLVDSVVAELARSGVQVQRIQYPIVVVDRDLTGELAQVHPHADAADPPDSCTTESWIHLEVDRISDRDRARELEQRLYSVLGDVREVVEDAEKMAVTAQSLAVQLESGRWPLPEEETREGAELLRWLADGNLTFLGYRQYTLDENVLRSVLASGLGVLRQDSLAARSLTAGPDETAATDRSLLMLTQASAPSTVHRPAYPFYVGLRTFDGNGELTGEHRFLGMLTTTALHENVLNIPVISRRVRQVIHRAGFPLESSYAAERMLEILQNWPRIELFSADADSLYRTVTGTIALTDRRRLRLFLRRDPYDRFFSCLVFLPRDRYNARARLAMQEVLLDELAGVHLEYSTRLGETPLAQVHFTVHIDPSDRAEVDLPHLQQRLADAVRSWDDQMVDAIIAEAGRRDHDPTETGETLSEQGHRYAVSFPEGYKEDFPATEALADLRRLESLTSGNELATSLYRAEHAGDRDWGFKLYLSGGGVRLSAMLPLLQSMGVEVVDERPYEIRPPGVERSWIYDFGIAPVQNLAGAFDELRPRFEEAFAAAWRGDCEVDAFNELVLCAGLTWRQAAVLRACARYLRQSGSLFSQAYVERTVLRNPTISAALVGLFETKFDPALDPGVRTARVEARTAEVTGLIGELPSLDENRILQRLASVIEATVRTNYHVVDEEGVPRPCLALKLDPSRVPDLPVPRPRYETFVYSPRVEGVHLRFGAVARGGLLWSDRREDYRGEILELLEAQAVRNAVIAPDGAMGGFVLNEPALGERLTGYRLFLSALLDLTDNLVDGEAVPVPGVVRYDGDDTYLMITDDLDDAGFSGSATEVAAGYGFWLGDWFARSAGLGPVTAESAWLSAGYHLRELGMDLQHDEFTVVGIGGADGFGQGLARCAQARLIAAFDERYVFLDPDPDPAGSAAERKRLSGLAEATWNDYDRTLISEGGGVWPRDAKVIPLAPRAAEVLGVSATGSLSGAELVRAVLRAPADLLWSFSTGTHVKGSSESTAGIRGRDPARVDASELRVRAAVEGTIGTLTEGGRAEFADGGGLVLAAFADTAAATDLADRHVNIGLMGKVLGTTGISAEIEAQARQVALERQARRLIAVRADRVDLPGAGTLVLLARVATKAKTDLGEELLTSGQLDSQLHEQLFADYFPTGLGPLPPAVQRAHPLRDRIVATELANELIDVAGPNFVSTLAAETKASAADIARAYLVAARIFDVPALWAGLAELDRRIPVEIDTTIVLEIRKLVLRSAGWLLRNRPQPLATGAEVHRFRARVTELMPALAGWLQGTDAATAAGTMRNLTDFGTPAALAGKVSVAAFASHLLDVVDLAELLEADEDPEVHLVGELYYALFHWLNIDKLLHALDQLPARGRWDALAATTLRNQLCTVVNGATKAIVRQHLSVPGTPHAMIEDWARSSGPRLRRASTVVDEVLANPSPGLAGVSFAAQALTGIVR
ncbi:NAD-glutamate dehydrogenase domain-containing protein [Amycolatopsis lurida]